MKNPRGSPNTCGSISTAPAIGVFVNFMLSNPSKLRVLADDAQQVFAVTALLQRFGQLHQLVGIDEPRAPGDFFYARNLQSLPFLDDSHESARIDQGIIRARTHPART